MEPHLHLLRPAARRPQQRLPRAHCVGQRGPGQQCIPGRSQARSWHRCVFSLIRSKSCSEFQIRCLKPVKHCTVLRGLKSFSRTLRRLMLYCAVMLTPYKYAFIQVKRGMTWNYLVKPWIKDIYSVHTKKQSWILTNLSFIWKQNIFSCTVKSWYSSSSYRGLQTEKNSKGKADYVSCEIWRVKLVVFCPVQWLRRVYFPWNGLTKHWNVLTYSHQKWIFMYL